MTSETLYSYRDAKSITQTLQCRQQDFVSFKGGILDSSGQLANSIGRFGETSHAS
jgi:hypothetical protein